MPCLDFLGDLLSWLTPEIRCGGSEILRGTACHPSPNELFGVALYQWLKTLMITSISNQVSEARLIRQPVIANRFTWSLLSPMQDRTKPISDMGRIRGPTRPATRPPTGRMNEPVISDAIATSDSAKPILPFLGLLIVAGIRVFAYLHRTLRLKLAGGAKRNRRSVAGGCSALPVVR